MIYVIVFLIVIIMFCGIFLCYKLSDKKIVVAHNVEEFTVLCKYKTGGRTKLVPTRVGNSTVMRPVTSEIHYKIILNNELELEIDYDIYNYVVKGDIIYICNDISVDGTIMNTSVLNKWYGVRNMED